MPESLFKLQLYYKEDSGTGIFQWILQDFSENIFYRTLLDECFYLTTVADCILFPLFFFFSFSLTNACLTCQLRKAYAVLLRANRFVGSEIPEHNDFDQFWKIKFHFQHFPRSTRFLSFDGRSNYLYLFKKQQQTFSWPAQRPPSNFKVTKMWCGPNIKYLSKPFFVDFWCWDGISCWF